MKPLATKSKGRLSLYALLLLLALCAMWSLRLCTTDTPFRAHDDGPSGGDTIDVAIEYSPMALYRYADTLGGFNYDLLREMAESYGLHIKFHPVSNFADALSKLNTGRYDLVVADIPMTSELDSQYLFSEPSFLSRQVLIQRRDSAGNIKIRNRLDLAGKQVNVSRGSSALMRLRNLSQEIGDTIYVVEDSVYGSEQLLILTAMGRIDYAVVNEHLARSMCGKFPNLELSIGVSFTQFQSWLMQRDNVNLKTLIDSCLTEIKKTDRYRQLEQRYTAIY